MCLISNGWRYYSILLYILLRVNVFGVQEMALMINSCSIFILFLLFSVLSFYVSFAALWRWRWFHHFHSISIFLLLFALFVYICSTKFNWCAQETIRKYLTIVNWQKKKNNNNKDKKHFQLKYNFNDKMFSLFSLA